LERDPPELDASYADEFATVSASQLIRATIPQSTGIIAHVFDNVAETAVNIGAIATSIQDTILSLIKNQLKGASSNGVEYAFLIWDPKRGPYLIPIGSGAPKYRLKMADSPGTRIKWSLSELVTDSRALFTNGDGNSDATEIKSSVLASQLNGDLKAYRTISLDNVNLEGAEAGRDAFMALREDPYGITGSFPAKDIITGIDGGQELAGLVKAGELAVVADALPFDSRMGREERTWTIDNTGFNPITGELSIALDQRSIESRDHERMTEIRVASRLLEPGLSHNIVLGNMITFEVVKTLNLDFPHQLNDEPFFFNLTRTSQVHIEVHVDVQDTTTSVSGVNFIVGAAFDNEEWDPTDAAQRGLNRFANGLEDETATVDGLPQPVHRNPGRHSVILYIQANHVGYQALNARFKIQTT
jgi:hypothetical protein